MNSADGDEVRTAGSPPRAGTGGRGRRLNEGAGGEEGGERGVEVAGSGSRRVGRGGGGEDTKAAGGADRVRSAEIGRAHV